MQHELQHGQPQVLPLHLQFKRCYDPVRERLDALEGTLD